jgi:hypothetical protein
MGTEIVKSSEVKLPKFVEQAYDSIEGMKQFANMLLESKLVPDSYYEKGVDNKPDYTKGKTSAVVIVLLQAQQLAVPPMTGLQHIVPVNGLLSIKGDLAKTMIFASGKLKKDSWVETVTGTIEDENMVVTITATREDNGITTTRSFSVEKAKRMGLWITSTQVNSADGWKYKKSAWFKTPDRMLFYRCLGNLARDLFSDVLLNMYTTEEAVDIVRETEEIIQTESGAKITIPDKEHSKERSGKMTTRVADKIPENKFGEVKKDNITDVQPVEETMNVPDPPKIAPIQQAIMNPIVKKESNPPNFVPEKGSIEVMDGKEIIREPKEGELTLAGMEKTDTEVLKKMVFEDMEMHEACELLGGKNTNKKLREILFANQNGNLKEYVANLLPKPDGAKEEDQGTKTPENASAGEIPVNKDFYKGVKELFPGELEGVKEKVTTNKYEIEVPAFDKGQSREFATVKILFNKMMGVHPQITTPRYMELAQQLGFLERFSDKEKFCRDATIEEINLLLDSN